MDHKRHLIIYTVLLLVQSVFVSLHVDIRSIGYKHNCEVGNCHLNFTFCVDRPTDNLTFSVDDCEYGFLPETSHLQDWKEIFFHENGRGIPVPWVFKVEKILDPKILFALRVRNADVNEHRVTLRQEMPLPLSPTRETAYYVRYHLATASSDYTFDFDIRAYCHRDYYGPTCQLFCVPKDTMLGGHYTCEPGTGRKLCLEGWTGESCKEHLDECSLSFCHNDIKDCVCLCKDSFIGKQCSVKTDPCGSSACPA